MLALVGFLPADDPRVLSTIEVTEARLTDARGLVYRYRTLDGLDGEEGTFLLCTFWLAQALARAGRPDRAREPCSNEPLSFVERRRAARRRGRPDDAASSSATSRRRSATSAWSTRPGRSAEAEATATVTAWPQWPAAQPPSTCSVSPVTKSASSRYSTAPMTSSTPPSRPMG